MHATGVGVAEGEVEGLVEGDVDGLVDGDVDGLVDGDVDGLVEGEVDGLVDGLVDGDVEGLVLGLIEGDGEGVPTTASQTATNGFTGSESSWVEMVGDVKDGTVEPPGIIEVVPVSETKTKLALSEPTVEHGISQNVVVE